MREADKLLWWLASAGAAVGFVGHLAGAGWGGFAAVVSAILLADLAWTKFPGSRGLRDLPAPVWMAGVAGGIFAAIGGLPTAFPTALRAAFVASGFQLLLVAAGILPGERRGSGLFLVATLGHATILLGTVLLLAGRAEGALVTCWGAGFAVVLLHAFWTQRERGGPGNEWEAVFLASLVAGLLVPVVFTLFDLDAALGLRLMLGIGLVALAVLGRPPLAPGRTELPAGGPAATLAHGLAAVVLVNSVLFAYSLVWGWAMTTLFALVLVWVATCATLEYRAILRAVQRHRRPREVPEPDVPPGAVTVIIAAKDEAHVLRPTLEHNLALDLPLRFILVPSSGSSRTVDLAHELRERFPDRVEVVPGTGGSKAADLNLAWPQVRTEHLLVLDADEAIDEAFLRRGLALLQAHPDVGIVQGRKVALDPDGSALARFVAAERRFSTWMDQPTQDEDGAAHFAGSGALLRMEAVREVDGWRPGTLTEDIDLTLRLRLGTRWRIAYEPTMLVRESNPSSMLELLQQRTRWSRGWVEVTGRYLPRVLRQSRHLGTRATASTSWQLVTAVSAPWATLLPLLVLVRAAGIHPLLPFAVALPLALLVLPSRFLAYAYAARRDPVAPLRGPWWRWPELLLHAYGWILLGWAVQLHALYLELSEAPREWHVTAKEAAPHAARAWPSRSSSSGAWPVRPRRRSRAASRT